MALGRKTLLLAAFCALAWGQTELTTIQDTLYKADGTRFNGTLTINWTTFRCDGNIWHHRAAERNRADIEPAIYRCILAPNTQPPFRPSQRLHRKLSKRRQPAVHGNLDRAGGRQTSHRSSGADRRPDHSPGRRGIHVRFNHATRIVRRGIAGGSGSTPPEGRRPMAPTAWPLSTTARQHRNCRRGSGGMRVDVDGTTGPCGGPIYSDAGKRPAARLTASTIRCSRWPTLPSDPVSCCFATAAFT